MESLAGGRASARRHADSILEICANSTRNELEKIWGVAPSGKRRVDSTTMITWVAIAQRSALFIFNVLKQI